MRHEYSLLWRNTELDDLPIIKRIGDEIHVDLPERLEVLVEKFRLFPDGCSVLSKGGAILGYAISHPWRLYAIPPYDTLLGKLPQSPDCMFIHDVVVLPAVRGLGATGELLQKISDAASDLAISTLALVSVHETYPFWTRHGFTVMADLRVHETLKSYGPSARYMIRTAGATAT